MWTLLSVKFYVHYLSFFILRREIPRGVNNPQVYALNQWPTTLVLINLLMSTCFGRNYEPSSGTV
jgi:hypothetical protein